MKNYMKMKAHVHYFKWTTGKINEIQYSWKDEKEAVIMKFEFFFPSRLPQVTKVSHKNREECRLHLIALDLRKEKKKEEPWLTDNILITQTDFSALKDSELSISTFVVSKKYYSNAHKAILANYAFHRNGEKLLSVV